MSATRVARRIRQIDMRIFHGVDRICLVDIGCFLLVILLVKPDCVNGIDELDSVWNATTAIVFYGTFLYLVMQKRFNVPLIFLAAFCAVYCYATFSMFPERLAGAVSESMRIWLMFAISSLFVEKKDLKFLDITSKAFTILLYIEFISFVIFAASGADLRKPVTFLGYDNYAVFLIVPMLTVILYAHHKIKGCFGLSAVLLFVLMFLEKAIARAATSIVVFLILSIAFAAFSRKTNIEKYVNHFTGLICLIILTFAIAFMHLQDFFSVVFGLLGKSVTLTGRTFIWNGSLNAIAANPVMGYGSISDEAFHIVAGLPLSEPTWNHTHNGILELMIISGLVGLIVYLFFLLSVFLGMSHRIKDDRDVGILLIGVFGFAILMFSDSYLFSTPIYALFALCHVRRNSRIFKHLSGFRNSR